MNLNQLKHFYMVCVYGSLSEASKHLYISQPSLSSSIKLLEKEFGVSLFNRRYIGMELTTEGKRLFEMCKDILCCVAIGKITSGICLKYFVLHYYPIVFPQLPVFFCRDSIYAILYKFKIFMNMT